MQSATVTVRRRPGVLVTHPAIPSTWVKPSDGSTCRTSVPCTWLPSTPAVKSELALGNASQRFMTSPTGSRLQRPRSNPRPGSSPRPVIPAITPYRSRQEAISYRGIAPPTEASATMLDVTLGLRWCGLLPIHPLDLRSESAQPFIDPL